MHNAACTVCHSVLDPVAGAFQNYDDTGYYRSAWGGLDSLDEFYKNSGFSTQVFEIHAARREDKQTFTATGWLSKETARLLLANPNNNWYDEETEEGGTPRARRSA